MSVAAELEPVRYILRRREAETAFQTTARELGTRSLWTKRGGRWHASTGRALWLGRDRYAPPALP